MKTSNLLWLFGLLAFTNGASWVETNPQPAWTNLVGKTFKGLFIRSDGVRAWIKPVTGAPVKVTVAELSAADQEAVVELNQDFSWKLRTVRWPEQVLAPATRPAVPVAGKREDKNYEYRTPTFSFLTDDPLNGKLVGAFGCVFEATYELLKQLPWEIRPTPADDGQFFHAKGMSADDNSCEQAMQVFAQQYVANRQLAGMPLGPEEKLLTQLFPLPIMWERRACRLVGMRYETKYCRRNQRCSQRTFQQPSPPKK